MLVILLCLRVISFVKLFITFFSKFIIYKKSLSDFQSSYFLHVFLIINYCVFEIYWIWIKDFSLLVLDRHIEGYRKYSTLWYKVFERGDEEHVESFCHRWERWVFFVIGWHERATPFWFFGFLFFGGYLFYIRVSYFFWFLFL